MLFGWVGLLVVVTVVVCCVSCCCWLRVWDVHRPRSWKSFHGSTRHSRVRGKSHSFRYPVTFDWVDIDDPPRWGRILQFDWRDHSFGSAEALRAFLRQRLGPEALGIDKIYLLTKLRFGGHCFNSISFFFVPEPGGSPQALSNGWLIYEVWNFPWYENTLYLHRLRAGRIVDDSVQTKTMHVSPFNSRDGLQYRSSIDMSKFDLARCTSQLLLVIDVMTLTNNEKTRPPTRDPNKKLVSSEHQFDSVLASTTKSSDDPNRASSHTIDLQKTLNDVASPSKRSPPSVPTARKSPFASSCEESPAPERVLTSTLFLSEAAPSFCRLWPTVVDIVLILYQAFRLWQKGNLVHYHKPKVEQN